MLIIIAVNPSRRSISNTNLSSPPSNIAPVEQASTNNPAVEDLRKQIKNLTEIVTKQEKPSASSQSDIDVLRAQVKTLTDLVLSKKDNVNYYSGQSITSLNQQHKFKFSTI
jgi:hypothetical protein